MAIGMIDTQNLTDIADAIREKSGSSDTFKPSEMAQGILDIPTGTEPTGTVNITTNGTVDVAEYASANVAVHGAEDALIQNTELNEYVNDRVTVVYGDYRFQKTNFKIIRLPNVTSTVGNYNFHGGDVSLLEELYLPKIATSGWNSYLNNPNLRVADIGKTFGGGKITGCPNLEILIIRDTSMKAVGNTWLTGSKLASDGTGGYVYVPQALLSQYQASQAWADYANVLAFRAIEGSIYE